MDNKNIYNSLNQGEGLKLRSYMGIIPYNADSYHFSVAQLEKDLKSNQDFSVRSIKPAKPKEGSIFYKDFNIEAVIEYNKIEYNISIYASKTDGLDFNTFSFANTVGEKELEIAQKQTFYLEAKILFDEDSMTSFLFQLKVLHTIMPNASLVLDFSSLRLLSPHWLKMSAESSIPPSPNYLYTIHAVYDELENGEQQYWMHTHGLHRCGSMELELANIKSGASEMYNLINTTANLFIMEHYKENETFQVGYDGLGISLCWLRWEEALKEFPMDILGGIKDRSIDNESDFNIHAEPSGILFAVEDGNYTSPEIYVSTLADNPIFYIREDETLRMSALAKERFHLFDETYSKHGKREIKKSSFLGKLFKKEEKETDWQFLVKLGISTDNAKTNSDKEHLWFEVISIDGKNLTGKLINQPYWISGLNENDIKTYPIKEVLTDWIIYGPENTYTPDSIYLIYH